MVISFQKYISVLLLLCFSWHDERPANFFQFLGVQFSAEFRNMSKKRFELPDPVETFPSDYLNQRFEQILILN